MKRLLLLLITFSPLWTMQREDVNREIEVDISFIIENNTNKTLSFHNNKREKIVIDKDKKSGKQLIDITDLETIKALGSLAVTSQLPLGSKVSCTIEYKPKEEKYSFTVKVGTKAIYKEAEGYILARDLKNIAKVNVLIEIEFRPSTGWLRSISHTISLKITTEKFSVEFKPPELAKITPGTYAILGLKPGASAYEILGVRKGASAKAIRSAHRFLMLKWSVDKPFKHPGVSPKDAGEVMVLINGAYEVLTKK